MPFDGMMDDYPECEKCNPLKGPIPNHKDVSMTESPEQLWERAQKEICVVVDHILFGSDNERGLEDIIKELRKLRMLRYKPLKQSELVAPLAPSAIRDTRTLRGQKLSSEALDKVVDLVRGSDSHGE